MHMCLYVTLRLRCSLQDVQLHMAEFVQNQKLKENNILVETAAVRVYMKMVFILLRCVKS